MTSASFTFLNQHSQLKRLPVSSTTEAFLARIRFKTSEIDPRRRQFRFSVNGITGNFTAEQLRKLAMVFFLFAKCGTLIAGLTTPNAETTGIWTFLSSIRTTRLGTDYLHFIIKGKIVVLTRSQAGDLGNELFCMANIFDGKPCCTHEPKPLSTRIIERIKACLN